ncbi:ribbon-helix-helix domain-containing protein [Vibrio sp. TRT 21S02]|uniref:ribbon-helix-helix domain-containing protein n=1 Tax=unclassified Vibrio TaxID=2614977 RepID=UPI00349F5831
MCQLFIQAEQDLWTSKTRSLRIDGVVTSIRLECFFWETLEEIAERDSLTVNQMITRLYRESLEAQHDISNFTSFLRVCCGRYLSLIADGAISRDRNSPLSEVDVECILAEERHREVLRTTIY